MVIVQEQAIEWIHQALHFDAAFTEEIVAIVPTIPLSLVGMPYCPACGQCHSLDLLPSDPECPGDHDTMGHNCVAWWQAFKAIHTVQSMNEDGV